MGALRAPLCLPGWEPAAPGSCSWLQLPQYSPSTPKEWQNFWFSSFWQPYTPSCSGCWPHPTPSGNKEWRYFTWTSELQIQSWVLAVNVAAPAVTCLRPCPALAAFLLLKTKNVEEFQVWLLPKQATVHGREGAPGQWPWNGSVSGLGQFCAALQVTAKTRFEIYSFTSGSESYRADDWLKSSTKFIFN